MGESRKSPILDSLYQVSSTPTLLVYQKSQSNSRLDEPERRDQGDSTEEGSVLGPLVAIRHRELLDNDFTSGDVKEGAASKRVEYDFDDVRG